MITRKFSGLLLALAMLGSCAASVEQPQGQVVTGALPAESLRVFGDTYRQIADKYVEPVSLAKVAGGGLENLKKLDANLAVSRTPEYLEARANGTLLQSFEMPRNNDARRWAELTVATINTVRAASPQLRNASTEAIYRTVLEGATQTLDLYSRYLDPESAADARAEREGFGGIGVTLESDGTEPRITTVFPDSPAAKAGLVVGERLMMIDGLSTSGLQLRDVVRRLRGREGRAVNLVLKRAVDAEPRPLTLVRALIFSPTVTYRREGDIAYIRLSGFNQATTESLNDAMRKAMREIGPRIGGVILDLRGNLGGLLDQAVAVTEVFLPEGPIVSTRGRHQASVQMSEAHGGGVGSRVPLVVLVNGMTASASEIVASALLDNGRAVVVGSTSYGKGSVQSVISLPNDGELRLTSARYYAPAGYTLQDLGVAPTICTSGQSGSASTILARAREGRMISAEVIQSWRNVDHSQTERLKELRQICPPTDTNNAADIDVAKSLLADRALYARAVRAMRPANEAAR